MLNIKRTPPYNNLKKKKTLSDIASVHRNLHSNPLQDFLVTPLNEDKIDELKTVVPNGADLAVRADRLM